MPEQDIQMSCNKMKTEEMRDNRSLGLFETAFHFECEQWKIKCLKFQSWSSMWNSGGFKNKFHINLFACSKEECISSDGNQFPINNNWNTNQS